MADPVTIALVAGGALSGASMIQQGRIQKAQGETQEKIAEYNADQARKQGEARLEASKIEATRVSRKERIVSAMNIARSAKSGISLSESPSTIEAMADVAYQFHLDRNLITQGGMQDFLSAEGQSSLLRAEGAFAKEQGRMAQTASFVGAAGQGLMTFGMVKAQMAKTPSTSSEFKGVGGGTLTNTQPTLTEIPNRTFG
jgi:hypothetical protein